MTVISRNTKQQSWRALSLLLVAGLTSATVSAEAATWSTCANENSYCSFTGTRTVRYGVDTRWAVKTLSGGSNCNNTVFGDPAYGTAKICQVDTSVSLPDLKIVSLSQSPAIPAVGQAVTFSAVVQNIGTIATPAGATIGLAFFVDGTKVSWGSTASSVLAPGATLTMVANGGPSGIATWKATTGTHTIQGFINDVARFPESDTTNNKLSKVLTVGSTVTPPTTPPTTPPPAPTPTPTPVPPTSAPPSSTGANNTIGQVIADMSLKSEALPINPDFKWMYQAIITQFSPAGSSIASWWSAERPTWCYGLQSWYTLFEAEGNTATNTRVEVKNLRVYILSQSTRKWAQWEVTVAPNTGLWAYPFTGAGTATRKMEPDGGVSFQPVYPKFMHGYGTGNHNTPLPNPADVRAVYTAIDMKLVIADPTKPDDRAQAKYVVDSGADYYPDATLKMWSAGYAPGVGNGRYILATPNWKSATLIVPNTNYGATLEEIRLNPPPL